MAPFQGQSFTVNGEVCNQNRMRRLEFMSDRLFPVHAENT